MAIDSGFCAKLGDQSRLKLSGEFVEYLSSCVFEAQVARDDFSDCQNVDSEWRVERFADFARFEREGDFRQVVRHAPAERELAEVTAVFAAGAV